MCLGCEWAVTTIVASCVGACVWWGVGGVGWWWGDWGWVGVILLGTRTLGLNFFSTQPGSPDNLKIEFREEHTLAHALYSVCGN